MTESKEETEDGEEETEEGGKKKKKGPRKLPAEMMAHLQAHLAEAKKLGWPGQEPSQTVVGRRLGLTQSMVSQINTGSVGIHTLIALRKSLRKSIDTLLGLDESDPLEQKRSSVVPYAKDVAESARQALAKAILRMEIDLPEPPDDKDT